MLDRGAKWLQLWSFLWGEFANFRGFLTMVEQKCLVEQIAVQTVPPNRPAGPSHGTAPCSKNIIKPLVSQHFFFARTNLLMHLFTQFWLSGGRHFGSPWGAILLIIRGATFWVSVGYHYGSAGGDIIILVRIITT